MAFEAMLNAAEQRTDLLFSTITALSMPRWVHRYLDGIRTGTGFKHDEISSMYSSACHGAIVLKKLPRTPKAAARLVSSGYLFETLASAILAQSMAADRKDIESALQRVANLREPVLCVHTKKAVAGS